MTQQSKKTPKDFAPHLVGVLGRLTEYIPGHAVPMESTYAPVCAAMELDEDALGTSSNHTSKVTHRQIGLAMRQLRDHGLSDYVRRGQWFLTRKGIEQALEYAGLPPMEETGEESGEEQPLAARSGATAQDEAEGDNVVHLPVTAAAHPYSDDPYIRSLAVKELPCFGAHSSRSDTCKACPLAGDCVLGASARKGDLAAQLDAADAKTAVLQKENAKAREMKDASVDELIEQYSDEDGSPRQSARTQGGSNGVFRPAKDQDVSSVTAQRESTCLQCEKVIPEEDVCKWVLDEGIFHNECVGDPL